MERTKTIAIILLTISTSIFANLYFVAKAEIRTKESQMIERALSFVI